MKEFRQGGNDDPGQLKDAVETVEKTLARSRRALAEMEARLAWSHSRQVRPLPESGCAGRSQSSGN